LNKTYGEFKKSKPPSTLDNNNDEADRATGRDVDSARIDDDDGIIINIDSDDKPVPSDNEDKAVDLEGTPQTPLNSRQTHKMKKLGRWFNPAATELSTRPIREATVIDRDSQSGRDTRTTSDT
jgi:hypothetical protein